MMRLLDVANALGLPCPQDALVTGVSIDSRQVMPGHVFIAISGERFDGHDFLEDVVAKGAVAVVCTRALPHLVIPQFVVQETADALTKIASEHRRRMSCAVIALTGSNGKTSVKEMIAAMLPPPSHATYGNLNNHYGVPLCVLQLRPEHRYAVFELGANHVGEIAHTVAIVQPNVTLINNVAPAHIEGFGSIDGVARAKGEIYQGLPVGGTAVINEDDAYAHFWDEFLLGKQVNRFSIKQPLAFHARAIVLDENGCASFVLVTPEGEVEIQLLVPGLHNVSNAVAAAACVQSLGISLEDVQKGLNQFTGVPGRMMVKPGKNSATIIDDTYNANLSSVLSALRVLAKRKGRRIFVFGDMGELGTSTEPHHREVGEVARELGIDILMTCGQHSKITTKSFGRGGGHYASQDELVAKLLQQLDKDTTVLVKGSRAAGMENIVHQLMEYSIQ